MATAALLAEAKEPPCTVLGRQATVRGLIVYEKTPPAWKEQLIREPNQVERWSSDLLFHILTGCRKYIAFCS